MNRREIHLEGETEDTHAEGVRYHGENPQEGPNLGILAVTVVIVIAVLAALIGRAG